MPSTVKRLFDTFAPEHYDLTIKPNAKTMTFSGEVTITGRKTGRPSQRITLHQNGLKITTATIEKIEKGTTTPVPLQRINTHKSLDEVRLHTEQTLFPGKYRVKLSFEAPITKPMNGLYPCFFKDNSSEKVLLATQFESHHAREVFPCIDEPEAKATFDLTLITPKHDTALSNMPVKSEEHLGELKKTSFETTPIMSTYLLAFVIGDLHKTSGTTKSGVEISTWATTAQPAAFMDYANNEAIKILEFFEAYFDTPFPLPKCDQVALPDFEAGAMENWGLITYREIALLTDPENRSVSSEQYVSMVVAHELSHQWFGNLVTMQWWDDLWLNESFASLMEHVALDALHPEWCQWEQYAASDIISCSNRDIYTSVQSVKVPVNHPDEIHSIFDPAIVYAKGGRLLKMMHDYVGDDAFRKGLKQYFKNHAYKNTLSDDLWSEMSTASGQDVGALMTPWLTQSGMPLVTVADKGEAAVRTLTQARFALDSDTDTTKWPIPLLATPKTDLELMTSDQTDLHFDDALPILNAHGSGHYVVHYQSDTDRTTVANKIAEQTIPSEARITLINDQLLLARKGVHSLRDVIDMISHLKSEPREPVWALIVRTLGLATNIGENNEVIEAGIKRLKRQLAVAQYNTLGWDDQEEDDANTRLLRATLIGLMLGAEDSATIEKSLCVYKESTSIEAIPADRRGAVLGSVVRHSGDTTAIQQLIDLYKETPNPDLQLSLSSALTYSKDQTLLQQLITEGLGPDGFVRPQDSFRWFAYLMRSKYSRDLAWNWLTSHWNYVLNDIGKKSLDHWVVYSAGPLQTAQWEEKFHEFYDSKKNIVAISRNIDIASAEIAARVAWRERDLPKLEAYFKK